MDIKKLLKDEVTRAKRKNKQNKKKEDRKELEANKLFLPIKKAMSQLSKELSKHKDIEFSIYDNFVNIYLGEETELTVHRYKGSDSFNIDKSVAPSEYFPELDGLLDSSYEFKKAEEVINYLVKKCAEYVAQKNN